MFVCLLFQTLKTSPKYGKKIKQNRQNKKLCLFWSGLTAKKLKCQQSCRVSRFLNSWQERRTQMKWHFFEVFSFNIYMSENVHLDLCIGCRKKCKNLSDYVQWHLQLETSLLLSEPDWEEFPRSPDRAAIELSYFLELWLETRRLESLFW